MSQSSVMQEVARMRCAECCVVKIETKKKEEEEETKPIKQEALVVPFFD